MSETARAFVALEIAAPMRERIAGVMGDPRRHIQDVRWAPVEQLHLTLRFLGDSTPSQLERVERGLAEAVRTCPQGAATVAGLGVFPERGGPRVLWLGLTLPDEVIALQHACERIAVAAGFEAERRDFRPHLTLGRWRGPARRPDLPPVDLGTTPLEHVILFRSELRPQGAIHTPLATFDLGG